VTALVVVLVAGVLTYGLRVSMVLVTGPRSLPRLQGLAPFVVPAAFSALVAGAVAARVPTAGAAVAQLVPLAVAFAVARVSGRSSLGLLAGVPVLWALSALV
jgi:branched-subunit amino acid transport protein